MRRWLAGEPSLDELLGDDIMGPVVASAGLSREQFRSNLTEIARRLGGISQGRTRQGGSDTTCAAVRC
jgi:hypothetical protein